LNFCTLSYVDASQIQKMSPFTRNKISARLKGYIHSLEIKNKMSKSRWGSANHYYGKRLHPATILVSQKARGKMVFVYSEKGMDLVNDKPFISIREAAKSLPISPSTLVKKLDSGIPFKGFFYYSIYK